MISMLFFFSQYFSVLDIWNVLKKYLDYTMEIYIGTPQVQIGNEIQKVDAESQTDLELLWDFIKLLRREGRYPEELEKPKRKRKTIIQTFGQMSDENSCSTDAPGLLSVSSF